MSNTIGLVILMAFPFAVIIAAIRAVRRWTGAWRTAAVLPLVGIGGDMLFAYIAGRFDPATHRLWPYELMTVTAICALFLIAAGSLRRASLQKDREQQQ